MLRVSAYEDGSHLTGDLLSVFAGVGVCSRKHTNTKVGELYLLVRTVETHRANIQQSSASPPQSGQ